MKRFAFLLLISLPITAYADGVSYNLSKEMIFTAFFAAAFTRNPLEGLFHAREYYGDTVSYYIEPGSEEFTINYGGQHVFNTESFLTGQIFHRWGHLFRFQRVAQRSDANFIFRERAAPFVGAGSLASAISYPIGYYQSWDNSYSQEGVLEIHPNHIEATIRNLNEVDRGHIAAQDSYELVHSSLIYIFTHEVGHILGFNHPERYTSGCPEPLTNQAPIMSFFTDYFRIQYHLNGDIPVTPSQIMPSEREILAFEQINNMLDRKLVISSQDLACNASGLNFLLTVLSSHKK